MTTHDGMPADLARAILAGGVTEIDARPDLLAGREPFQRIMDAVRALPGGGVLLLRAIFEPAPLYRVLDRQGFAHWTVRDADDDWRVWFYRSPAEESARGAPPVVLDVRGLEPPEPLVRTLEALERLPAGAALVQLNERVPRFLFPRLTERGFTAEVADETPGLVRVVIRRPSSRDAPAVGPDDRVHALLHAHPETAPVFERFGVHTCCGGDVALAAAALRDGVSLEALLAALRDAVATSRGG